MTTFCVSGAALAKAGINRSSDLSGGNLVNGVYVVDSWILQAEAVINSLTKRNWIDAYSTLNADVKLILEDTAASLAAMDCVSYDLNSYPSNAEAETMLDKLRDAVVRNVEILKEKPIQDFMVGA